MNNVLDTFVTSLPKFWAIPLAWAWNIVILGLSFDIGCALIYRFMSNRNPHRNTIFNIIKQSTSANQI